MYKYSKIYLYNGNSSWGQMLEGMFEDCLWIARNTGTHSKFDNRWSFADTVVSNGYQRTYTFKHAEDYAAFVLARG